MFSIADKQNVRVRVNICAHIFQVPQRKTDSDIERNYSEYV